MKETWGQVLSEGNCTLVLKKKNKQHALDPVYSEEREMKRSQEEGKGKTEKRDGERKEGQVKEEVADLLCLKERGEKGRGKTRG